MKLFQIGDTPYYIVSESYIIQNFIHSRNSGFYTFKSSHSIIPRFLNVGRASNSIIPHFLLM